MGRLEEIAYSMNFITADDVARIAQSMRSITYGEYFVRMLEQESESAVHSN